MWQELRWEVRRLLGNESETVHTKTQVELARHLVKTSWLEGNTRCKHPVRSFCSGKEMYRCRHYGKIRVKREDRRHMRSFWGGLVCSEVHGLVRSLESDVGT